MVPLDGPARANVRLLGSPCFEIPRSVTSDPRFDHLRTGEEFRRRLRAKNRHDLETMGLFLAVRWVQAFVITVFAMAAWELYGGNTVLVLAGLALATLLFSLGYFITVERALMGFGSLRPRHCSIYDPYFWWHERYWKLLAPLIGMLNGTPFKSPVWRLVGVRIGRRVFDDGCAIAERTLVTIGDHCTLNAGSVIRCHSMEDGIFKADYTVLEDGCTLGTGALVHYGVTMGYGAQLRPDSFLMKGEKVPPNARWGGNRPGRCDDAPLTCTIPQTAERGLPRDDPERGSVTSRWPRGEAGDRCPGARPPRRRPCPAGTSRRRPPQPGPAGRPGSGDRTAAGPPDAAARA
jgi:non-ribosomal peptide synthetase-like protein